MAGYGSDTRYRSYLIRCWASGDNTEAPPVWRFSIAPAGDPGPGAFVARIEDLVAFLEGQLQAPEPGCIEST